MARSKATFHLSKKGVAGRPVVEVALVGKGTLADVSGLLTKNITRNADVLKRVGLRACPACISGFDIWIRERFDDIIQV